MVKDKPGKAESILCLDEILFLLPLPMTDPISSLCCPKANYIDFPLRKMSTLPAQLNELTHHSGLWRLLYPTPQPFRNWFSAFLMLKNRYRPLLFYYLHKSPLLRGCLPCTNTQGQQTQQHQSAAVLAKLFCHQ